MSAPTETCLQVGRFWISTDQARDWVAAYVAKGPTRYGYPAYDSYRMEYRGTPLTDADLLAPLLLNAGPKLSGYYWMQEQVDELNIALKRIEETADLTHEGIPLEPIGQLFGVLDRPDKTGAGVTILAKVLHLKRPAYIPLYDQFVANCYTKGPHVPVPRRSGRRYHDYVIEIVRAIRTDLLRDVTAWRTLRDLAQEPSITELRALDIVAWNVGKNPSASCSAHEHRLRTT